jgi:hypothetical protein
VKRLEREYSLIDRFKYDTNLLKNGPFLAGNIGKMVKLLQRQTGRGSNFLNLAAIRTRRKKVNFLPWDKTRRDTCYLMAKHFSLSRTFQLFNSAQGSAMIPL